MTTATLSPQVNFTSSYAAPAMSLRQRRRLVRSILSLSLLIVIGAGFSAVSSASDSHTNVGTQGFVKVVVGNGQSLWNLATIINSNDPTTIVDEIIAANNLHNSDVTPGQSLWVPTK
jgi:LysM repeat protein